MEFEDYTDNYEKITTRFKSFHGFYFWVEIEIHENSAVHHQYILDELTEKIKDDDALSDEYTIVDREYVVYAEALNKDEDEPEDDYEKPSLETVMYHLMK